MKKTLLNSIFLLFTVFGTSLNVLAQDCEIAVGFVETYDCNAADGIYSIDFGIEVGNATNDSVDVWINNDFMGLFEIQDFLSIDNIPLQDNSDDALLLVCVHDNTQCCYVYSYEEPECEEDECDFEYLEVEAICNDDGNYTLIIEYGINNPLSELLFLYVNDVLLGEYEIAPNGFGVLEIHNVEPVDGDTGSILLCSGEGEACCEDAEYEQPECDGDEECSVDYIEAEYSECENGTYTLTIFYGISNPDNDFLDLWVNNNFIDFFEIDDDGEGVITIDGVEPRENSDYDIVEICVNDNPNCCALLEYLQPECEEEECDFEFLEVGVECQDNGNYTLIIEFEVINPFAEFVQLWINDEYYGEFELNGNGGGTITIENVEPVDGDLGHVLVCVGEGESCCEDVNYEQIECEGEECNFEYLEVVAECDEDGNYTLFIEYGINNPVSDFIELWINDDYYDEFEIQANGFWFLEIEGVEPVDGDFGFILLCTGESDDCCEEAEYEQPECDGGEECGFEFLEVGVECQDDGNYILIIEYEVVNPSGDFVQLWINDNYIDEYEVNSGAITVDNVEPVGGDLGHVLLCVGEGESCCEDVNYEQIECEGEECNVDYIEVETSECEGGTYTLTVFYGISNADNDLLDLWVNNEYVGFYEIANNGEGEIVVEGVEPRENTDWDIVEICVNDNPDCCLALEYLHPACEEEECNFEYLEVGAECDEDGNYILTIEYGINNPDSDFIELWVNGDYFGEFELEANGFWFIEVDGVEPVDGDFGYILLCTGDSDNCCEEAEYEQPECEEEECSIDFIEIETECNGDNYDLYIYYDVTNPGNDFIELWISGDYIDFFEISNDPIIIENLNVGEPGGLIEIQLCINDNADCCLEASYGVPECSGLEDDDLPFSLIVDSSTDDIVLTPLNKQPYNIMMFSMDAKLLSKAENEEGISRMPVREPGIYIIRVETERKVFYSKILYIQ